MKKLIVDWYMYNVSYQQFKFIRAVNSLEWFILTDDKRNMILWYLSISHLRIKDINRLKEVRDYENKSKNDYIHLKIQTS